MCGLAVAVVPSARTSELALQAPAGHPLDTAFVGDEFRGPEKQVAFDHARAAGARFIRLAVWWSEIAPSGSVAPSGFNPRDPSDPLYRWDTPDDQVRKAAAAGLIPIVDVLDAPTWAQLGQKRDPSDGPVRPRPDAIGDFAAAIAERYGGDYSDLPRVTYWQLWNEPNLSIYLMPQSENERLFSPAWYRAMVNAMAREVHAVHGDNVVIAGGLAPFGGKSNDPSGGFVPTPERTHPLEFMREMLCISKGPSPKPTCREQSEFDVWSHHPYTYGGPTHHAFHPDDVSIGDLREMRKLLEAAEAAGNIRSRSRVKFWVTEFSWDTSPPDPKGLKLPLHARWVSEALYRMWTAGVSLVTWWSIRDEPFPAGMFQAGLYFRGDDGIASDKPKPALQAFRFPFVAFKQKNKSITFWGRTPTSSKKAVVVEQKQGAKWKRLATPIVNRYGIFQGRVTSKSRGSFRARLVKGRETSLPFSLTVPKDFRFCPWGSFC